MTSPALSEVTMAIRTLMALVFLTAAVGKMRHWTVFQGVIANYRLLPTSLVAPFAYFLPPFEAVLGAALLIGLLRPWPELAATTLLTMFAVAMGINLQRGRRHIDCGCFQSALRQSLSWNLVIRNGVMVVLLGAASMLEDRSGDLAMKLEGIMVGGVLFVILQSLNILWGIVPAWRRDQRFASEATR
jgi:uncharacterized membrane protein YphA (DoxX/SURF4 family)